MESIAINDYIGSHEADWIVNSLATLELNTRLYIYDIRYTDGRYEETVIIAASTTPKNTAPKLYWSNTGYILI